MKEALSKRISTLCFILLVSAILLYSLDLEHDDKANSPIKEYYEDNMQETGSRNMVEAVLLDYRAYDTFGEVIVLYLAIIGVLLLGKKARREDA